MTRCLLSILLLMTLTGRIGAQGVTNSCVKSTEGKDFWFGYMESRHHQTGHYLELTLTSTFPCHFTIYFGKSTTPFVVNTLTPNVPFRWQPPWTLIEPIGSEIIEQKAIHIVSDLPMNVFAMNWSPSSADAAVIFPVEALGNEYYAMCYEPHINEGAGGAPGSGKNSEFLVVASEDNTLITITPTKITDQLRPVNVPFTITLNKGELYQVQSMNHANLAGQGDLTGSYIKSNKNIAFYSGSWSTSIPADSNVDAWDHLYEQIPPVRSWGRKFVTVPLKGRSQDRFRVIASEDKTSIRIGSNAPVMLSKGKFYEFVLTSSQPSLIECDHPILLAQFMVSNSVDRPAGVSSSNWDGDPLMLVISPVDQTREAVTFVAYDSPNIKSKFFVNVVTKTDYIYDVFLDNQPITFQTLGTSGYSYAQIAITKGNHNLNSAQPGKGFIAYVYGYGGVESYGYGVGFNLSIKLDLGGDIHFSKDTILLCKGQAKILDAGAHFSKFLWSTGDTTQTIFVTKAGYSKVTASTVDGCVMTDSIYTYVSNPVVNLGNDTTICNPKSLILYPGPGYASYLWNTNETKSYITASKSGLYSVLIKNQYDCAAKDSIYVGFVDKPKIDLHSLDSLICGKKTTTLNLSADKGKYQLLNNNPLVTVNGMTTTVSQYGTYPYTFVSTDLFSCVADTTFTLGFHEIPALNLGNDTTICKPLTITLDAGAGLANYLWTTKDSLRTIKVQTPGSYGVLVKNKYGCSNQDNILVNFTDVPKLDLSKLDTLNCGVKSTIFNISADKGKYSLKANDPRVTINGLSANVSAYGSYPINFKATDQYGCAAETIFKVGFHEVPPLNLGNDTTICNPLSLVLDAGSGQSSYLWTTGETVRSIKIQTPGTYGVLVRNSYSCSSQDNILVNFVNLPKLDLSKLDTLNCGVKSTVIHLSADKGNYTLKSSSPDVKINGLTATVSKYGTYPFNFKATDQFACTTETNFTAGFHETPPLNLGNDTTMCRPQTILLDAGGGMASYLWTTKDSLRSVKIQAPGNYGVLIRRDRKSVV